MKQKNKEPVLHKTIVRVDVKPTLEHYNQYVAAAEHLRSGHFDYWQMADHGNVSVYDWSKRMSVNITPTAIVFDADNPDVSLVDPMLEPVTEVLDQLGAAEILRIGVRRIFVVPVSLEFNSLVGIMNVKYLNQDSDLTTILGTVTDCLYRVYTADGPVKIYYQVGATHNTEMQRNLMFNGALHLDPRTATADLKAVYDKYPSVGLHIDIDAWTVEAGYTSEGILDFYREQCDVITRKAGQIAQYTLGTSL